MTERQQLHIPWQRRTPLLLKEKSCHLHLSSLAFQNSAQQADSVNFALRSLGEAFETRDFDTLYRCTVGLVRGDGTVTEITLSSANAQLHGLNPDAEAFRFGYEPEIAALIDCFVGNEGTLADIGANFGYFSIYLASRAGFRGVAHAFEPSPRGFADLERMVTGFGLGEQIRIYQCALGDSAGKVDLLLSNSDGLTTMVASMANRVEKVVGRHTADLRRLDDFALPRVDLVKIDVEGAEAMVIAGALDTIKAHRPVVVFESWNAVDDSRAFAQLQELGYRFFGPAWVNRQGQMGLSIANAADPSKLVLVSFLPAERKGMSERINVAAIHGEHVDRLSAAR
jgi:FkbM family methyltransferase